MPGSLDYIAQQLSDRFHQPVQIKSRLQVFGGSINQTFRLDTTTGSFFLKRNNGALNDMFQKEFEGLQLLYQTQTIRVPQPVLYGTFQSQIFLITEFVEKGDAAKNFWQTFAHQLAALHTYSHQRFGLLSDNYIGSLPQQNTYCGSWPEFYATQRIAPMMQLAFDKNKCRKADVLEAEKLCKRLYNLLPEEKPALVHGDLWSGNFMSGEQGRPVIYDPAVYYGSREMDIAMSLLFGGFNNSFYNYYNEAFPLQAGWRNRVPLYTLYPMLVHLILFGGPYYYKAMDIIKAYA